MSFALRNGFNCGLLVDNFIREQYELHSERIYRLCLRFSAGDPAWAEDAMHDVFVRLMKHGHRVDDENVAGWLTTSAYRYCIDRVRRERGIWARVRFRLRARVQSESRPPSGELDQYESRAELQRVSAFLVDLEPTELAVFTLKHLDDLDQSDVAKTLGLSKGYVSKILKRIRDKLAKAGWSSHDGD